MTVDEEKLVSSTGKLAREVTVNQGSVRRGRKERRDPNGRTGSNRGF